MRDAILSRESIVDAEEILGGLIRGALASRAKRHGRTQAAIGSIINARTILAAAGVAWGVYEAASGARPASAPPPLPPAGGPPEHVVRLVRLLISAARADGDLSLEERGVIQEHARKAGAEALVRQELATPKALAEIVAGLTDPRLKADLYTLAFSVVRADESVGGAERIYLAQLAHQLGLDQATTARLESETAARIDAAPGG